MVTATTGTMILQGVSGREYSYSIYISDVVGAFATFSTSGPAGTASSNFIITPENCVLKDISTLLAPTVAVTVQLYVNDMPTGVLIQDANTLFSNTTRSIPHAKIGGGRKLQFVQN